MSPVPARCLPFAVVLALLLVAPVSQAADAVAEALFRDAIELMKAGDFEQACPKLQASHAREARSGTLLVLASCHEQQGKSATAWAEYTEAATLARTEGREENAKKADESAEAVRPTLSTLRIDVATRQPGLAVQLDGSPVAPASFGTALPIDPGEHVLVVTAPGYVDWTSTVTVGPAADQQQVAIPTLEKVAEPPPPPPPAPAPAVLPPPAPAPPPVPWPARDASDGDGVPIWAWVVGGTGVGLLIASALFRVDQASAGTELDDACGSDRTNCPRDYDFTSDRDREQRSFGLFIGLGAAGIAALTAGVIGAIASSSTPSRTAWRTDVWFDANSAGVGASGRF